MTPTLKTFPTTKLIGKNLSFSYANYRIGELWSSFMPRRNEIKNIIGTELYNIQINPVGFSFQPNEEFVKWTAVAVSSFDFVPDGMETLEIPAGLYAVFNYKGDASGAQAFFSTIFTVWLPNSDYVLDSRPHFEILGEKYKKDCPTSEEEIWIPVKKK
jgi:AraC family transcriptional regulator